MADSESGIVTIVVLLLLLYTYIVFLCGQYVGGELQRNLAVENNVARWTVDSTTGEKTFTWGVEKENNDEKKSQGRR